MTVVIVAIVIITILAAWIATQRSEPAAVTRSTPVSPLDEAERILAQRYARREISAEEYERMLTILKR